MAFALPPETSVAPRAWQLTLRVTALSFALGAFIQFGIFGLAATAEWLHGARPTFTTALAFVGWGTVACVTITYARIVLQVRQRGMAVAGASAALLGVVASLAITWALATAMSEPSSAGLRGPLIAGAWKALEYGALGAAVFALGRHGAGAIAHAALGLGWGVAFGGAFLVIVHFALGPLNAAALASRAVTELLFPVGCALILWYEARAIV